MPVNVAATDNSSSSTRAASTKSSSSSSGGGLEGVMSAATAAGGIIQRPPGSPGLPAGYYSTRAAAGRCSDLRPVTTLTSLLGNHTRVGALRISAHGHEGWVVAGALPYLKAVHRPEVIALDYWPAAMRAAGYTNPEHLLWQLYQLGYKDAAHAGRACEQRWADLTRALHWQVGGREPGLLGGRSCHTGSGRGPDLYCLGSGTVPAGQLGQCMLCSARCMGLPPQVDDACHYCC